VTIIKDLGWEELGGSYAIPRVHMRRVDKATRQAGDTAGFADGRGTTHQGQLQYSSRSSKGQGYPFSQSPGKDTV
jgi:hypothetical protein